MAERTVKVCDIFEALENVESVRVVVIVGGTEKLRIAKDMGQRAQNRLLKSIETACRPPISKDKSTEQS